MPRFVDSDQPWRSDMQSNHYFTFLALELARERTAEANAQRLAALAHPVPQRPSIVRRVIARAALAVAHAADAEAAQVSLTSH